MSGGSNLPWDCWTVIFRIYLAQPGFHPKRIGVVRAICRKTREWINQNRENWMTWTTPFLPPREISAGYNTTVLSDSQYKAVKDMAYHMTDPRAKLIIFNVHISYARHILFSMLLEFICKHTDWNIGTLQCSIPKDFANYENRIIEGKTKRNGRIDLGSSDIFIHMSNNSCVVPEDLSMLCEQMLQSQKSCILIRDANRRDQDDHFSCLNPVVIEVTRTDWMSISKRKRLRY